MDPQLEEDLAEALGDCDPLELVLQDPILAGVAEEMVYSCSQNNGTNEHDTNESSRTSCQLSPASVSDITSDSSCDNSVDDTANTSSNPKSPNQVRRIYKCACCGRPARGIYYYGGQVCDSCRAFFGRSIKNDVYKSFICEENCGEASNPRSWMKCQFCRFDQLCKVGLNIPKKKVKNSGLAATSTQPIFSAKDSVYQHCKNRTVHLMVSSSTLTPTERLVVENFTAMQARHAYDVVGKFLRQDEKALRANLDFLYHGINIPSRTAKHSLDYFIFGFQQQLRQRDSWLIPNKLSSKDLTRLVAANYPLCNEFMEALRINETYMSTFDMKNEIEHFVNSVITGLDQAGKEKVLEIHSKVSKRGTQMPVVTTYEMVYDPDELGISSDKELSEHHRWLTKKVQGSPGVKWDLVALMLNIMVIIFTPDFIQLDDDKEAERVQLAYASLLYKYLKDKRTARSDAMFRESMLSISYARELKDIRNRSYARLRV